MHKWEVLTREVLASLFEIKNSGIVWKVGRNKGEFAGTPDSGGYLQVDLRARFNNSSCLVYVHQIVHMLDKGYVPNRIDHRDRNKLNNAPSNLRETSPSHNTLNSKMPETNTSGYKGVVFEKDRGKWRGKFTYLGKRYVTSRVDSAEEANRLLEIKRREIIPDYESIIGENP